MKDVVIVDSVRTGLTKSFRGSFNATRPDSLAAHCIDQLLERNPAVEASSVEDCVVGCAVPEGAQGMNIGRTSAVLSKLPISTAGMTVNRFCSSGMQAIAIAAQQIAAGLADVMVAGGTESVTLTQKTMNFNGLVNPIIQESKPGIYMSMGQTAEIVAKRYNITREMQDEYALQSQQRTAKAQQAGLFQDEIVPTTVTYLHKDKATGEESEIEKTVLGDECNRADTTLEGLATLKPSFDENGSVGPGNSSQLSDGASMTLLMSLEKAKALGLKPLAYFRGMVVAGCEPDEMGIGPIYAIPNLLKRKGLTLNHIDLIELNEAFASQTVYIRDKLGLNNDILNINGGAISIGHPYGMTGSRLVGHIARELSRQGKQFGIVTMCVGGGMGAAGLVEAY